MILLLSNINKTICICEHITISVCVLNAVAVLHRDCCFVITASLSTSQYVIRDIEKAQDAIELSTVVSVFAAFLSLERAKR
jgi:hypothetical protein